ncbi:MAG: hypothetical protein IPN17_27440 [Deltaproteobacteria bacterium]|nr:hypothetical protein [Deltaproteobacteria bacterium]
MVARRARPQHRAPKEGIVIADERADATPRIAVRLEIPRSDVPAAVDAVVARDAPVAVDIPVVMDTPVVMGRGVVMG